MRRILLDTNLLINALDKKEQESLNKLKELLNDSDVNIFITPLIHYEVLRGIEWEDKEKFNEIKETLDNLVCLDVGKDESELATHLFRLDTHKNKVTGKNMEKRKFDVFHFSSSICNNLEFISLDGDIKKIKELYDNIA